MIDVQDRRGEKKSDKRQSDSLGLFTRFTLDRKTDTGLTNLIIRRKVFCFCLIRSYPLRTLWQQKKGKKSEMVQSLATQLFVKFSAFSMCRLYRKQMATVLTYNYNYNTATDTFMNDVHKYDKDSHLPLHIFQIKLDVWWWNSAWFDHNHWIIWVKLAVNGWAMVLRV